MLVTPVSSCFGDFGLGVPQKPFDVKVRREERDGQHVVHKKAGSMSWSQRTLQSAPTGVRHIAYASHNHGLRKKPAMDGVGEIIRLSACFGLPFTQVGPVLLRVDAEET